MDKIYACGLSKRQRYTMHAVRSGPTIITPAPASAAHTTHDRHARRATLDYRLYPTTTVHAHPRHTRHHGLRRRRVRRAACRVVRSGACFVGPGGSRAARDCPRLIHKAHGTVKFISSASPKEVHREARRLYAELAKFMVHRAQDRLGAPPVLRLALGPRLHCARTTHRIYDGCIQRHRPYQLELAALHALRVLSGHSQCAAPSRSSRGWLHGPREAELRLGRHAHTNHHHIRPLEDGELVRG